MDVTAVDALIPRVAAVVEEHVAVAVLAEEGVAGISLVPLGNSQPRKKAPASLLWSGVQGLVRADILGYAAL